MADQDSRLFLRRRDVAHDLGVSERQVLKWETQGLLEPVRYEGLRVVRYRAADVRALAAKLSNQSVSS